jgi:hypothetical protein
MRPKPRAARQIKSGFPSRHPDRRVRLLCGRGSTTIFSKRQYLPWWGKALFRGPGLTNKRKPLLEPLVGLRHGDTEALEFVVAVAFADPEFEPAVRQILKALGP